jgi:hydroxymethylglutaryl-CoA lyase
VSVLPGFPTRLDVREVGMRDGLQLEAPVPLRLKLAMLDAIVATGARRVEVTSFVSPRLVPALADADRLASELGRWDGVSWSALVANRRGAVRAIDAGIANLEYVISASDSHGLANARRRSDEALDEVGGIAEIVHAVRGSLEVIIATAWDCPFEGPVPPDRVVDIARKSVASGADELCVADTIGTTTPRRLVSLVDAVRAAAVVQVGVHLHDTRGTGQANVLAAALSGVTKFDSSIGGLGGCPFAPGASGNIATEDLAYWAEDSGVSTGLDVDAAVDAAGLVRRIVGHELTSSLHRAGGRLVPRGLYHPPADQSSG